MKKVFLCFLLVSTVFLYGFDSPESDALYENSSQINKTIENWNFFKKEYTSEKDDWYTKANIFIDFLKNKKEFSAKALKVNGEICLLLKDDKTAMFWLERAVKEGYNSAINDLKILKDDILHLSNEIDNFKKNWEASDTEKENFKQLFLKFGKSKNPDDLKLVADFYDTRKYPQREEVWLLKAAKLGHLEAQAVLGGLYLYSEKEHGVQAVNNDFKKAIKWLTKSADKGYSKAQQQLAILFFKGEVVEEDLKKSLHYAKLASAQGEKTATIMVNYFQEQQEQKQASVAKQQEQNNKWANIDISLESGGFISTRLDKYTISLKQTHDLNGKIDYYGSDEDSVQFGSFGSSAHLSAPYGIYSMECIGQKNNKKVFSKSWKNLKINSNYMQITLYGDNTTPYIKRINN